MNSDTDIVNRLNQRWLSHADKDVRFVLVHRDEWIRCTDLTREAADEIERLRKRLLAEENAYDIERRQNEHLQTDRNNLALEAERLRKELEESESLLDEYQREAADRTRWENTDDI